MEEFKYGDLVEVRDGEEPWCKAAFIAYDKDAAEYKYVARQYSCAGGYRQCRHARPDLKPGQPVVVWMKGEPPSKKNIRIFKEWSENGLCMCFDNGRFGYDESSIWECYALLKNYDYTAPVEQF